MCLGLEPRIPNSIKLKSFAPKSPSISFQMNYMVARGIKEMSFSYTGCFQDANAHPNLFSHRAWHTSTSIWNEALANPFVRRSTSSLLEDTCGVHTSPLSKFFMKCLSTSTCLILSCFTRLWATSVANLLPQYNLIGLCRLILEFYGMILRYNNWNLILLRQSISYFSKLPDCHQQKCSITMLISCQRWNLHNQNQNTLLMLTLSHSGTIFLSLVWLLNSRELCKLVVNEPSTDCAWTYHAHCIPMVESMKDKLVCQLTSNTFPYRQPYLHSLLQAFNSC